MPTYNMKFLKSIALFMISSLLILTQSCTLQSSDETSPSLTEQQETTMDTNTKSTETQAPETNNPLIDDIIPASGDKIRIACVGDSITYGTSVANRAMNSYPAKLEALLGKAVVKVGNFGKPSAYVLASDNPYNVKTDASLSYKNTAEFRASLAFDPDVVIIMLGTNDLRSLTAPTSGRCREGCPD